MSTEEFIEIGRLQKPHGIKGEIAAVIDSGIDTSRLTYVITVIDGLNVPFFISSMRQRGSESILLTLDGINNERDAAELSMLPILIRKSDFSELSEEYIDDDPDTLSAYDLKGYTIFDEAQDGTTKIGIIEDINELTADNWLFEVRATDGRTIMIPVANDLITDIDTDSKSITMDLPTGLTDL